MTNRDNITYHLLGQTYRYGGDGDAVLQITHYGNGLTIKAIVPAPTPFLNSILEDLTYPFIPGRDIVVYQE